MSVGLLGAYDRLNRRAKSAGIELVSRIGVLNARLYVALPLSPHFFLNIHLTRSQSTLHNVRNDDLDPMGLTAHPQHSTHGSLHDDKVGRGAPRDSSAHGHHLDHAPSERDPQSTEPSHSGLALYVQQQLPPIPVLTPTSTYLGPERFRIAVSRALATVFWLTYLIS
jgi:4-amino-4-deoxy-L-arabinose transferase-like glycosyltransferase